MQQKMCLFTVLGGHEDGSAEEAFHHNSPRGIGHQFVHSQGIPSRPDGQSYDNLKKRKASKQHISLPTSFPCSITFQAAKTLHPADNSHCCISSTYSKTTWELSEGSSSHLDGDDGTITSTFGCGSESSAGVCSARIRQSVVLSLWPFFFWLDTLHSPSDSPLLSQLSPQSLALLVEMSRGRLSSLGREQYALKGGRRRYKLPSDESGFAGASREEEITALFCRRPPLFWLRCL